jgi:CheY-like chemotaxis protein
MLAYAGRQDLQRREPVDLTGLLRELRRLIEATLSKKATLVLEPEAGTVVLGDRALFTQVLINLLTNASDALGSTPGQITVRTRAVHEPTPLWQHALGTKIVPGAWVQLEVEDNGCGMDEATRERAFEPFFSTKERGQGLGLAACLGIITNLGGALRVDSTPGRGTCFSMLLPAAAPVSTGTAPRARTDGVCRVLVIDDEELVRHQLRRTLELRGYHVEEAVDGFSGIAHYNDRGADVLIVDVTMPDIDGIEVVRRIRGAGSRAAIILSSGYQAEPAADRLEPSQYQGFLPKPYGMREVLEAVERARARVAAQS